MSFVFTPSPHFVRAGDEASHTLDTDAETAIDVARLRKFYPELSDWGDWALHEAWGSFSQQVYMMHWQTVNEREENFLNFCCWEQTRGEFPWGNDISELAKAGAWRG
ncbi:MULTISPECIES: hypothetical protein [Pseudomonas]|uniref:hypothetical protein n=1 Tax=Pseudomonas TaxID=286 RepID=UPI00084A80D3|nr:hypothetical protein [Pseudomonas sp. AP19]OEC63282.1 hypothetical protein A7D21_28820 [Pseudomonas sp. AP19]